MKSIINENNINKYYVVIGSICIVSVIVLLILSISENTKQYLVERGTLEHTEIATAYIIKNEKTIEKDKSKVIVPVIAEGSRISKGDIIATYKGEEYQNYEETLAKMDKEILERMKDLPTVYSSEIDAIEKTIYSLVKASIEETSYNKMQEYKQKINTNINKRANIIGELSPEGAEIKTLIKERNEYEAQAKKSNDNILATVPGIVSYTVDGLEDEFDYTRVEDLNYESIKQIVREKKEINNTKIKIVNNYEAYIVMKVGIENAQYIQEGDKYRLRLIEQDNYEFVAILQRVKQLEDGIEVYFRISNGIEHIVSLREVEIEIVWDYAQGLVTPAKALNDYEKIDGVYLKVIKQGEYTNIPVMVKIENENSVVVENYTEEELEQLGIECEYTLKLYDRIIVENKK